MNRNRRDTGHVPGVWSRGQTHALRIGILLLLIPFFNPVIRCQQLLDSLAIEVRDHSREFAYTNKETAFFYGETNSENSPGWQGFTVYGHRFLCDYQLLVDGRPLRRADVLKVLVFPDHLERFFQDGIIEKFTIVDSLPLIAVTVTSPKPVRLSIAPLFSGVRGPEAFQIRHDTGCALLALKTHLVRTEEQNYPVWLSIYGAGFQPLDTVSQQGSLFSPVILRSAKSTLHTVAFGVGNTADEAASLAREYPALASSYSARRRLRIESLISESRVETGDTRYNRALAWAKVSLDALMMDQGGRGIFAGLPWFDNYWGRDTFISLPGATLVTGRFSEAKAILRKFAEYQERDSTSPNYGRIPNIVTTTDRAYNTADGTPRFIMMLREYIERSGDERFILEMYPVVLRSIEGTLKYHVDRFGFLTHGDAETWMDAVGPNGPWSPRGNRANDVQALWLQQVDAGIWFATRVGDVASARSWNDVRTRLFRNFPREFIHAGRVADHLRPDGTPDMKLRPNQIFTAPLIDDAMRAKTLAVVVDSLTYPYGVASLSQSDIDFHPYHQHPPYYPKDAAYHNGTVWIWLQGAVISELSHFNRQDLAVSLTSNAVHQILDRGAVGTISELLDAIPEVEAREPRLSGTFSQAWSLAEFIRNFYDDYLGFKVKLPEHIMMLRPRIPRSMGSVQAILHVGIHTIDLKYIRSGNASSITIDHRHIRDQFTVQVDWDEGSNGQVKFEFNLPPGRISKITIKSDSLTILEDNKLQRSLSLHLLRPHTMPFISSLKFATPHLQPYLHALRGPGYTLLTDAEAKRENPAAVILVDAPDPAGDDTGTGAYTYPRNPAFVPGSFDLEHFTATLDSEHVYFALKFRNLSDPGWHPEYGFQLTFISIAIHQDESPGSVIVPANSNYQLHQKDAYQKLILVGGGIELRDGTGRILAAYVPTVRGKGHPLGDVESGTVSFALPIRLLGEPTRQWRFTILAGAQDDHGGAGIGEFRTVQEDAGEWNGGGKLRPTDPNIYDTLVASPR